MLNESSCIESFDIIGVIATFVSQHPGRTASQPPHLEAVQAPTDFMAPAQEIGRQVATSHIF